ncbi:LANO_0C08020g1_1 [Lachancea nothofagi CBS 11611]|uniref:LANO_0C08020g1_1 n=1 Tax=Lachancea nothofagi CBS 11611 TaxID=1266666 RepID=A0A1G4J942_9SACH|nr:LANO_0C08020g1_1 [Lachancea nothofagi CBS 11611]
MRLSSAITSLLSLGAASASLVARDSIDGLDFDISLIEETVPMKYIKLDFDKLRGDSPETAVKGAQGAAHLVKRSDGTALVYLKNEQTFYSVEIGVGTPAQNQTLLIDTGSSDLWIMGSNNPFCAGSTSSKKDVAIDERGILSFLSSLTATLTVTASATASNVPSRSSVSSDQATLSCSEWGTFATGSSSSFESNDTSFYIVYGDNTYALGTWGSDKVTLQNLEIPRVNFAVANESTSEFGVMGIGMEELESTYALASSAADRHTYVNFPSALKAQGDIHSKAFSLFLDTLDAKHGSILFGAIDHSKYSGTLYTVPIINTYKSKGYANPIRFEITMQGMGLYANKTSTTFTNSKIPVVLDSGSTISYLPDTLVTAVAKKLKASYSSSSSAYIFSCSEVSDDDSFVFDFGGFQIRSALSNYVLDVVDNSICALGLVPQDADSSFILGDNFLTAAYVVYDMDNMEISMAQANYNGGAESIDIITSTVPGAVKAPMYSSTYGSSLSVATGGNIFTLSSNAIVSTSATSNGTVTGSGTTISRSGSSSSTSTSTSGKKNAAVGVVAPSHGVYSFFTILGVSMVAALL